jgi:hypothetical protein
MRHPPTGLAPIIDAGAIRPSRIPSARRPSRRRTTACAQNGAPSATRCPANHECVALRPPRISIRAPAVAATDRGRRARGRAAGIGRHEARYDSPNRTPGSSRPVPLCQVPAGTRLRVGIPVKWLLAEVPGLRRAHRQPTDAAPTMDAPPSAPRASPSAGWRSRRRTAGGGTGRRHRAAGCAGWQPNPADFRHPAAITPGTTARAARRRRVKWPPSAHRASPSARPRSR